MTNFQRHPRFRNLTLIVLGVVIGLAVRAANGQSLYVLKPGSTNRDISDADAKRPNIAGVTYRVPWAVLNPRRTSFDFTEVAEGVNQAVRVGKPMKLIVQTGRGGASPNWFGGKWMTDGSKSAPVPWSPEFKLAHAIFVQKLGERFGNSPAIACAHITGPTWPSAEMHPMPNIERVQGYSDLKMLNAWKDAIDAYDVAFPGKFLALSISVQRPANRYVENVIAYARAHLGDRLILEHNSLAAKTDVTADHHVLLLRHKAAGGRIGFEMICAAADDHVRFGSRDVNAGIRIGREAGAQFIDVYGPDIKGVK